MNVLKEIPLQLRAALRILIFILILIYYFIRAGLLYCSTNDVILRRSRLIKNTTHVSRLILKVFGVKLVCRNPIPHHEASLLVGNHIGFIDIVCMQALTSCVFITSLEMKNTPVLGQITDLGGCAYVNRKSRTSIQNELQDLVKTLVDGFKVVLYAESVASNGEQVLPFKKTLLTAAGKSQRPIRPFVFNFVSVNNGPVKYHHRDSLCWYTDESFVTAIWRSLKLRTITCQIDFLPLVQTAEGEDRTALAQKVHALVSEKFVPFKPDMS